MVLNRCFTTSSDQWSTLFQLFNYIIGDENKITNKNNYESKNITTNHVNMWHWDGPTDKTGVARERFSCKERGFLYA